MAKLFSVLGVGGSGFTGLLDLVTGAAAAYSVARKLRAAYAGSAIRLREDAGQTESDFGFTGANETDVAAIAAWILAAGATNAYVVKIYDQSGNVRDMAQATALSQPLYVESGNLGNSKPTGSYNGTSRRMTNAALGALFSGSDKAFSVVSIVRAITSFAAVRTFFGLGRAASGTPIHVFGFSTTPNFRSARRDDASTLKSILAETPAINTVYIMSNIFTGLIGSVFQNGSQVGVDTDQDVGDTTLDFASVGSRSATLEFFLGEIGDLVVWPTALSTGDRVSVETNMSDYY